MKVTKGILTLEGAALGHFNVEYLMGCAQNSMTENGLSYYFTSGHTVNFDFKTKESMLAALNIAYEVLQGLQQSKQEQKVRYIAQQDQVLNFVRVIQKEFEDEET